MGKFVPIPVVLMLRWSVILFYLQSAIAFGQFEENYKPPRIQDTIPPEIAIAIQAGLEADKKAITGFSPQITSFLRSLYEKRSEYLIRNFNDDLFIIDDEITKYLAAVQDEIYKANPQLPRKTNVYALRSATPNAVSFGDGTLGFTLGLLARMESDAQVAFVICHEMAHYYKDHSRLNLEEIARLNYDKELKKKIDAVKKNSYERYTRLKEIFKGMGFSINKHSREYENDADATGFFYFARTKFNPAAALRVIEILDSAEKSNMQEEIDLKKHFDTGGYAFKPSWVEYKKSTRWYAPPEDGDSAKTHPDCQQRTVALKLQMQSLGSDTSGRDNIFSRNSTYYSIKSEFELIESQYHFKQYGKALFAALSLSNRFPQNVYLHTMISKCLYKLYEYQKKHELGKVLDLPDPRFPDNYDRFLTFIHKLRLVEIASIAYHYTTTRPTANFDDEEFLYAVWLVSRLEVSKLDPAKVSEDYAVKYPQGKYLSQMK